MYPRKKTAAGNCVMKDNKKDVINNEELSVTQSTFVCFLN